MENMQIVPFPKNVLPQYVELKVPLYSHGCERKVRKALSHLKGIHLSLSLGLFFPLIFSHYCHPVLHLYISLSRISSTFLNIVISLSTAPLLHHRTLQICHQTM